MANIVLTYKCNLKCSYCFANEFVNKNSSEISIENFQKALKFIYAGKPSTIGLIGGEPAMHSQFGQMLDILVKDKDVNRVFIYTNGILLEPYVKQLVNNKFVLLVNCNSPDMIGEQYDKLCQNLDLLYQNRALRKRINLGINLFSDEMDYSFILDLLKRYKSKYLRISLIVPNDTTGKDYDPVSYFKNKLPFVIELFEKLAKIDVVPNFDCNIIPSCVYTEEQKQLIKELFKKYKKTKRYAILTNFSSKCAPVVDILPDLTAIRCFGMSEFLKVPISQMESLSDLRNYFITKIDSFAINSAKSSECINCNKRETQICSAGCLVYKLEDIAKMNQYCKELIEQQL